MATLTALEIVLGIDNIIFISILSGRLPEDQRGRGRMIGLAAAMVMRLVLLAKATYEIHHNLEGEGAHEPTPKP